MKRKELEDKKKKLIRFYLFNKLKIDNEIYLSSRQLYMQDEMRKKKFQIVFA